MVSSSASPDVSRIEYCPSEVNETGLLLVTVCTSRGVVGAEVDRRDAEDGMLKVLAH